jgi:hypothetical protein
MAIKKQEFYEGAALHLIARSGHIKSVQYESPFFFLNDRITLLLKYSTKNRSPWGFTFTEEEQRQLLTKATPERAYARSRPECIRYPAWFRLVK